MTSLPQTRQRNFLAEDSPASRHTSSRRPGRLRFRPRSPTLPAVDPSNAFGWRTGLLYPDLSVGRSATEALVA